MCWQDVEIGRASGVVQTSVSIVQSVIEVVRYSPNRIALIISAPIANRVTLSPNPTVADVQGITLYAGGPPLVLNLKDHGEAVTCQYNGISNTGTNVVGVTEVLLPEGWKPRGEV